MERGEEERAGRVIIYQVKTGRPKDGYLPVTLVTGRGEVACRYYPVEGTHLGAVWVGGVGGDWDSPARELYPRLSEELKGNNVASLRVRYRYPTILEEAVHDVRAGIGFLESQGISRIALTGHSLGGAVVIQAAVAANSVKTVVTLATQSYGADAVADLCPDCSILLIHGTEDRVLSSFSTRHVYDMAHEPKRSVILPGNGHGLNESSDEVEQMVREWIVSELTE